MKNYDLYSPFDIEQHKRTYQNYLEILIQADGEIVYAVPSHTEKACSLACEKLNLTRDELVNSCPPEYYCDYLNWLLMQTGSIAVWNKFFIGSPNHAQQAALRKLKQAGLYHGPISKTKKGREETLKILTSYNALGLSPDTPAEKVADCLINEFESDSTHNGPLAYLQNWIVSHSANITTGSISKTKILSEITLWNSNAVFHAIRACERLDNAQYFASDVTTDKAQSVYRDVYNAIGVILNKFHPTQPGVYLDNPMGYPYWHTLLTEAESKDIEAHPEKYLIVDLPFTHHPA